MGIVETVALVDFRIGPEFGALPQFDTDGQRRVEGLLGLRPAGKAVRPFVRRTERRITLLDVCRLPMHRENIGVVREARGRDRCRPRRIVEAIVESETELLLRKTRADALTRRREIHANRRKIGPEILAADGPARRDRRLDAGAGRPAESVEKAVFRIAARVLDQLLLVVSPGEAARGVEQPVTWRVTDAATHGA